MPTGFRLGDLAAQVWVRTGELAPTYGVRQAAYDLRKLRAKGLVIPGAQSHRYQVPPEGLRAIAALVVLRERVIKPILAATAKPQQGRTPKHRTWIDDHYQTRGKDMQLLFAERGLAA